MTQLFRRAWEVTIGGLGSAAGTQVPLATPALDVSNLDIEFKILCSIKPVPNRCVLTIWNMTAGHRGDLLKRNNPSNDIKKIVGIPVQVAAGYVGAMPVLFRGDLREVASTREGTDWKTIISGDDGGRATREARINKQFSAGTPISTVVKQCADAMGVGLGNVTDHTNGAEFLGMGAKLPHTFTASGSAASVLASVLESAGLTWSIQQGALQVLRKGEAVSNEAVLLSPDTGLLDSPEAAIDATVSLGNAQLFAKDKKPKTPKTPQPKDPGIIKVKSLLRPGLYPGRKIVLQSAMYNAGYVITEVEYVGQTWSTTWEANMICRVY